MKTGNPPMLDRMLDSFGRILTPDAAERLVRFRFDRKTRARIDRLARKCNEGTLTEAERSDYESAVHAIDFIALLQAKARSLVRQSAAAR
jgi:hypothetical protein